MEWSVERIILNLLMTFVGKLLSFSPLTMMLAVVFADIYVFSKLGKSLSIPSLQTAFVTNVCCILSNTVSSI